MKVDYIEEIPGIVYGTYNYQCMLYIADTVPQLELEKQRRCHEDEMMSTDHSKGTNDTNNTIINIIIHTVL